MIDLFLSRFLGLCSRLSCFIFPHLFSRSVSGSGLMGLEHVLPESSGAPSPPTDRGVIDLAALLWSNGEGGEAHSGQKAPAERK